MATSSSSQQQKQQQDSADASVQALYTEDEAARLCHKWVETGLTENPAIQFLLQKLDDLGCRPPTGFIQCLQCDKPGAGFFGMVQEERIVDGKKMDECTSYAEMLQRESQGQSKLTVAPEIYLCQQYLENELMAHKTMVHELIHAIDQCRTNMDPLHNCLHIACTEIRAENLSGECSFWKELPRMTKFAGHGKECVRRRAILSVRGNPNCTERAEEFVDAALPRCFQDVYPYERHPNQT